ncbi:MAG: ABC transporter permease [Desulfurococcales archaeon]|nr:ABC transporter permease [Desulfurococcales archaeon]
MSFKDIVLAELKFVYADVFRRKSVLIMFMMYPYVLTIFVLLIGYSMGSTQVFAERVGVDPAIFFITAGFILMAILGVGDDLLWRPMFDEWVGTLPYVIASPVSRLQHYIAVPIPRLLLVLVSGATSVIPVLTYFYGIQGLIEGLAILALTALGAILFVTLIMFIIGIVYGVGGENWRIINVLRPVIMILLGAYYPRFLMPLAGKIVSSLIPSSHVIEAIQRILTGYDPSLLNIFSLLGIATALFILYAIPGGKSVLFWEKRKIMEGVKV